MGSVPARARAKLLYTPHPQLSTALSRTNQQAACLNCGRGDSNLGGEPHGPPWLYRRMTAIRRPFRELAERCEMSTAPGSHELRLG